MLYRLAPFLRAFDGLPLEAWEAYLVREAETARKAAGVSRLVCHGVRDWHAAAGTNGATLRHAMRQARPNDYRPPRKSGRKVRRSRDFAIYLEYRMLTLGPVTIPQLGPEDRPTETKSFPGFNYSSSAARVMLANWLNERRAP